MEILETERLILRELILDDAEFILALLNTPTWLQYIGDKNVSTLLEAQDYIKNSPMASYKTHGFGLWLVLLKEKQMPIGMCGLLKRDTLDDVDIGFALMPEHAKFGYGFESALATMNYAKNTLGIKKIIGITSNKNSASISLLNKIGLHFEKTVEFTKDDKALLFSPFDAKKDRLEIDKLTTLFFDSFTNTDNQTPNLKSLKSLFISAGIIINNSISNPEIYDVDGFISPRERMLTDGSLTDFSEREISNNTDIFRNVATRFCLYEKSGILNGNYFDTKGMKAIQYIKQNGKWLISSVAWNDET